MTVPKEKRVVPEDYFRVLKQKKEADNKHNKPQNAAAVPKSVIQSVRGDQKNSPDGINAPPGLAYLVQVIHPDMEDEDAISLIELPQETIYLIDKVVRQKAKAGPIGIDNSEFINIEIEEEFKEKNQYIQNLVDGYKKKTIPQGEDEYVNTTQDEDGNKENQHNQRVLDRLSLAAAKNGSNPALLNNQSHISGGKNTTLGGSGASGLIN